MEPQLEPSFHAHVFTAWENIPFDPELYSRFKYGSLKALRWVTDALFDAVVPFVDRMNLAHSPLVLTGAPFDHLPAASTHLAAQLAARLTHHFKPRLDAPIRSIQIRRGHSFIKDYSLLDRSARTTRLAAEPFRVDVEGLRGKQLLILDDVRITGAHEGRIRELLRGIPEQVPHAYAYFARCTDPTVSPLLESRLNQAWVLADGSNLGDFLKECLADPKDDVMWNIRLVKLVLSMEYECFLSSVLPLLDGRLLDDLFRSALGEGLSIREPYVQNFLAIADRTLQAY